MKICRTCEISKPLTDFYKHKQTKDGHNSECKECTKKRSKKRAEMHPEKVKAYKKKYYKENKEAQNERRRKRRNQNREEFRQKRREKYQTDSQHKLTKRFRNRLRKLVNKDRCTNTTRDLLGIEFDEFKKYFEDQFEEGMTWENHGEWHIEHIIPCSAFDQEKPQHRAVCWHYTNLRPMWANENLSKGDQLPEDMNIDEYVDQTLTLIQS